MNFLDWIKKYSIAISFLFGAITGALTMYYSFKIRFDTTDIKFDTVDFKINTIQQQYKMEFENIYDVLHRQHNKLMNRKP
jgi:hypothetical protein